MEKRRTIVLRNNTLALATAISAGVVFAMPVTSEATQVKTKVYVTGSQSNLQKKKSNAWWRRHCRVSNDVKCGRHYTRRHQYNEPYTGYRRHKSGVSITVD
jgi:hypothetical protein